MTRDELLTLLYADLSNTMGCTDVGAIGYAAARAARELKGELQRAELVLSDLLYKNALRVGIPGTHTAGVNKAILLGYLLRNPEKKLSVFEGASPLQLERLAQLEQSVQVGVSHIERKDPLYIDLTLHSADHHARVLILHAYDNVAEVQVDGERVFSSESDGCEDTRPIARLDTSIDELYRFVACEDEALEGLVGMAQINYQTAQLDLEDSDNIDVNAEPDLEQIAVPVRKHILAASGLRMSGSAVPVTGVAGSGNLGITTLTSVMVLSRALGSNATDTRRALALAILVSTYIKRKMTLLTTICGSSLAGGSAVAAATVFLRGGSLEQIKQAINMLIAINAGTLCDGAKPSCALKVGFSAENAVVTANMALQGNYLEGANGINKTDVEQSIRNIADINNQALGKASEKILQII